MAGMTKLANISTKALVIVVQDTTHYVIPPPALPQPPDKELAVPTIFLSKKPVHQTWHGTKVPPRIPTKNRNAIRPCGLVTRPAMAVGIEPHSRRPTKTRRGPKRSQSGPATNLTSNLEIESVNQYIWYGSCFPCYSYVARRATIFEFAICCWLMFRSCRIVAVNYNSFIVSVWCLLQFTSGIWQRRRTKGGNAYHERNATMNPSHEKVNTRPYLSKGFSTGIDSAFRLLVFIFGDMNSSCTNSIALAPSYFDTCV